MAIKNGGEYVKEQIISILSQIGISDELIVSDDGSSDDTLAVIDQIQDDRIKVIHHHAGGRQFVNTTSKVTANFEYALRHAKGEVVFLSDQDDVWCPNKVEVMMDYLKEYDLVVSDAYVTDGNLNVVHDTRFFPGCGQTKSLRKAYFLRILIKVAAWPLKGLCWKKRCLFLMW